MIRPTLPDIFEAKNRIAPYIVRTPLHRHLGLDKLLGAEIYVKHENYQKLGAFKVRGGINLLSQMPQADLNRGISTASSGNHGQSIAYAANLFGAKAIIGVPEGANPGKVESMRNLGAQIIFNGAHFDQTRSYIEGLSGEKGYRYVHPVNEPSLIAGVGTYSLEIIEDLPQVDVIVVPIGGGSGASGACIVSKTINPHIAVIGIQAARAPAAYLSWRSGRIEESPMKTTAEGLATGMGYELTQGIIRDLLDDFVLVSDEEMNRAMVLHFEHTRTLTEHAGAASLAGALKIRERLKSKRVVLVVSGGNPSMQHIHEALDQSGYGLDAQSGRP